MSKLKGDNTIISIGGVEKSIERIINLNLELVSKQIAVWQLNRLHIFLNLLKNEKKIAEISKSLTLTESAVYKNIREGSLNVLVSVFEEMSGIINSGIRK